jgi:hypothetical protein
MMDRRDPSRPEALFQPSARNGRVRSVWFSIAAMLLPRLSLLLLFFIAGPAIAADPAPAPALRILRDECLGCHKSGQIPHTPSPLHIQGKLDQAASKPIS